jgi:EAL domain-containing protein (putative c-di-GMP-specific phosphodiesterase class I)
MVMAKAPLFVWCVRESHAGSERFAVVESLVQQVRRGSAEALEAHLTGAMTLPDVVLIERWDPALATMLDDMPRVWLDPIAAEHDEITASEPCDGARLVEALVTSVNLGRARLIRDALHSAQRREMAAPRPPMPDLDDFALHFQARWSINGTSLIGVETLLRWNGLPVPTLPPEALVAAAERRGDMRRLGDWIIQRACRHAAEWRFLWPDPMRLSINISPMQLAADDFTGVLAGALDDNHLEPGLIELEIPLAELPKIAERHGGIIADLYDLGVGFALDGVGADVIDPTLLTWLPATTWKFHRALIGRLPDHRAASALVGTLIEAARSQDILTVAVGVEHEAQRAALESLRCDALQGYLFAEPLAPSEFTSLLAAHGERPRSRA